MSALRPNWMIRGTLFPTNGSRMFYRTNVRYMSMRRGHDVLHDGCFWGKLEDVGTMQVRIAQTLNIYRSPEIVASKVQKLQRATKKKFIHANVCSHIVWLFPCFIPEKWNCGTGPWNSSTQPRWKPGWISRIQNSTMGRPLNLTGISSRMTHSQEPIFCISLLFSRWRNPSRICPKNRALIPPPQPPMTRHRTERRRSSQNFSTPSNCITEKFPTRVSATSIPRLD